MKNQIVHKLNEACIWYRLPCIQGPGLALVLGCSRSLHKPSLCGNTTSRDILEVEPKGTDIQLTRVILLGIGGRAGAMLDWLARPRATGRLCSICHHDRSSEVIDICRAGRAVWWIGEKLCDLGDQSQGTWRGAIACGPSRWLILTYLPFPTATSARASGIATPTLLACLMHRMNISSTPYDRRGDIRLIP